MAGSPVHYGLHNVHYAVVTETVDSSTGEIETSYGTVKAWPGAVSLELSPEGSNNPFYADDRNWFDKFSNNGYTGSFESVEVPEDVTINVYGQDKATNGLITESIDDSSKYIALMFEIEGDPSHRRMVFYRCMLSRPTTGSNTTTDSIEVKTESVDITVSARPDDGKIKAFCDSSATIYSTFFNSVPVATSTAG